MTEAIILTADDYNEAYSAACDAIFRALKPEHVDPDDGFRHTSDVARAVARAVFAAVNIVKEPPSVMPPDDIPRELHELWLGSFHVHHGERDDHTAFYEFARRLAEYMQRGTPPGDNPD